MDTPDASEVQIAAERGLQKLIAGNQRFHQLCSAGRGWSCGCTIYMSLL